MASRNARERTVAQIESAFAELIAKRDWNKLIYLLRDMNFTKQFTGPELLEDTTYYVRKDGSDGNDGLSDTPYGAFLTIQAAVNNLTSVRKNGYTVTIQVGAGTYSEDIEWRDQGNRTSSQKLFLVGDIATPANVVIDSYYTAIFLQGVNATVQGFTFTTTYGASTSYGEGAQVRDACFVRFENCNFAGTGLNGILVFDTGRITVFNCEISGTYQTFLKMFGAGCQASMFGSLTIPNALSWDVAMIVASGPCMVVSSAAISGAGVAGTTGKRYDASFGAMINVLGAGSDYFPGDVAGTTATGAVYA